MSLAQIQLPLISKWIERLKLAVESYRMWLSPVVQPVLSVDDVLTTSRVTGGSIAVTGVAWYTALTVTMGKQWKIKGVQCYVSSGTWTFSKFQIVKASNGLQCGIANEFASATLHFEQVNDVVLNEKDSIQVYADTHAVNGNGDFRVLIEERDV